MHLSQFSNHQADLHDVYYSSQTCTEDIEWVHGKCIVAGVGAPSPTTTNLPVFHCTGTLDPKKADDIGPPPAKFAAASSNALAAGGADGLCNVAMKSLDIFSGGPPPLAFCIAIT